MANVNCILELAQKIVDSAESSNPPPITFEEWTKISLEAENHLASQYGLLMEAESILWGITP